MSKFHEILSHGFYIGMFRYSGELYEGSHEPLISKKLFDQVQVVLAQRAKPRIRHEDLMPFLGLIHCGECDCAITAERQKGHHYYRCTKKKGPCSLARYIREETLEDQLRETIQTVSLSSTAAEKMLAKIAEWKAKDVNESKKWMEIHNSNWWRLLKLARTYFEQKS